MAAQQHAAAPDNDYLLISQAGVDARRSSGSRGEDPRARALPLPRRVRLRGEPERAPDPPAARADADAAPGDGRRPRRRAGARPRRRDAAGRRARDRPLRRGALDLHRARVPDAGRALAHAAHGGRPLRARPGRRSTRRSTASSSGARTATARATTAALLVLRHERPVLDAARPSRPRVAGDRRGPRRARRSRGSARPRSTAAGSRTCTCSCSPTSSGDLDGRRAARGGRPLPQRLPRPEPAARPARAASRRAPPRPDIAARRRTVMSRALSLAYREPLHIVRGEGAYLYDADGRAYLDLVNNVAHVGHCHPRVVAAGRAADGGAEHQHALPARLGRRLRAPARRDAAGPAARLLLRQLRLGGQRPRAAARRTPTPAATT